jgi:hypothetical protein
MAPSWSRSCRSTAASPYLVSSSSPAGLQPTVVPPWRRRLGSVRRPVIYRTGNECEWAPFHSCCHLTN